MSPITEIGDTGGQRDLETVELRSSLFSKYFLGKTNKQTR